MINVNQKLGVKPADTSQDLHQTTGFVSGIVNWRLKTCTSAWRPPTDMIETDTIITIRVEIAGMDKSDFAITLEDQIITISGSRLEKNPNGAFHQMEIHSGFFSTSIEISSEINAKQIKAEYLDGFLTIILPKVLK